MSPHAGSRIIDVLVAARSRQATFEVPGAAATSLGAVVRYADTLVAELDHLGFHYPARIALVGANGAAFLAAFFAATMRTTCAPLNPAHTRAEFEFYLTDLKADALMLVDGASTAAADAATGLGIPVVPVGTSPGASDRFAPGAHDEGGDRRPDSEVALVLHTSGTTSRSKIVPLTHANLCASARNISRALELGSSDRYLNVMPWFHVHGLMAALATLQSGGAMICPAAFRAGVFLEWLRDLRPTWYSAVPSMHGAIVDQITRHGDAAISHTLRFIRSGSAPLAPSLMARLETLFDVPVIECYGMTEAANQMTSNPLPPGRRKPGSVGRPAGPAVAVADDSGRLLGALEIGEVVVRGENVTSGYEHPPGPAAEAFWGGWFRTGDQGYLDEDGYLFLAGRLKEMINRGGEKIAPREIDEALLAHPDVAQAAAFAVPHRRLGEAVGAAVVLKPDARVTERELRQHVAVRLADFKVPRVLRFVNVIPMGATGKLQRIGLAVALGITSGGATDQHEFIEPQGPTETALAVLWCAVLNIDNAGTRDDFFMSGGDSLAMAPLLERVRDVFDMEISIAAFLEEPTIAGLAKLIERHRNGSSAIPPRRSSLPK